MIRVLFNRRSFLGASTCIAAAGAASPLTAMNGVHVQAEPGAERFREFELSDLADIMESVPLWTDAVPGDLPDWTAALEAAALLQIVPLAETRTAIAMIADRRRRDGVPSPFVDAQLLCLQDLIFDCRDDRSVLVRRMTEVWAGEPIPDVEGAVLPGLVQILRWGASGPQFQYELTRKGMGVGGGLPSLLHEFDRRVRTGAPLRKGLPNIVAELMVDVPGPASGSIGVLIARLAARSKPFRTRLQQQREERAAARRK